MTLTVWGTLVRCFVGRPSGGISLTFSLWLGRDYVFFLREGCEDQCQFYHIASRIHSVGMSCHCWCWSWSSGPGVFVRYLHSKVILSFPLSTLYSGRSCVQARLKHLCSCHLKVTYRTHYWEFCMEDLSVVLHFLIRLCSYLFISVGTNEYLFYAVCIFNVCSYPDTYITNLFSQSVVFP